MHTDPPPLPPLSLSPLDSFCNKTNSTASQPVFLYLICGGTLVMALSVFTSGVEDDIATYQMVAASCTATYWLYSLGFVGVITAMFSKIWMLSNVSYDYILILMIKKRFILKFLTFLVNSCYNQLLTRNRSSRNLEMNSEFKLLDRTFYSRSLLYSESIFLSSSYGL